MRIISGKYKGRTFDPPAGLPARPTMDRAREGLFNILIHRFDIEGKTCLDLFAGAGGVSYELLSRGAASVLAVDKDRRCAAFIQSVLTKLGDENGKVVQEDVTRFIRRQTGPFDLVFADPPYAMNGQKEMAETILTQLLAPEGLFILEHDSRIEMNDIAGYFETRVYGNSAFSFFEKP